jgi:IS1 family transposase
MSLVGERIKHCSHGKRRSHRWAFAISTPKLERKHLTLRIRIKRLVRKTICFSRSAQMHDLLIGLFINRFEFGLPISFSDIN